MSDRFAEQRESRKRQDGQLEALGFSTARSTGADWASKSFTVCLTCGAMIALDDVEELVEGMYTERGVRLHVAWHGAQQP